MRLSNSLASVVEPFAVAFTERSFRRFIVLLLRTIVCNGRRTVANIVRTIEPIADLHLCNFCRFLSEAPWKLWVVGGVLARQLVKTFRAKVGVLELVLDDTTVEHHGKHVWGKGRHRDGVRSSQAHTVTVYGHRWIVLALQVAVPWTTRKLALPLAVALYLPKDVCEALGRKYRSPSELAIVLLYRVFGWLPGVRFTLAVDGGFSTHLLARFAVRHADRVTLVGKCHPRCLLYAAPPVRSQRRRGRPRKLGQRLPRPVDFVQAHRSKARTATVSWYGGHTRRVALLSSTGLWYRRGQALVPMRWVHVRDLDGTHRDEYLFCTAPQSLPRRDRLHLHRPLEHRNHLPGGQDLLPTRNPPLSPRQVRLLRHPPCHSASTLLSSSFTPAFLLRAEAPNRLSVGRGRRPAATPTCCLSSGPTSGSAVFLQITPSHACCTHYPHHSYALRSPCYASPRDV